MLENLINQQAILPVKWSAQHVQAFTTTRLHPFKRYNNQPHSGYDDFNLGLHVGDDPAKVLVNRQQLAKLLPDNTSIQWLEQVHGNKYIN